MTATQFVQYKGHGFWAYDVALGIFLKHLIDAAEASGRPCSPWLSQAVKSWRVIAGVSDFGLTFKGDWSEAERDGFLALAQDACSRLSRRRSIPAEEIVSWPLEGDLRIFPRGAANVATGPVIELGRAIIALISGTLPDAPPDTAWFYGTPRGRETIGFHKQ